MSRVEAPSLIAYRTQPRALANSASSDGGVISKCLLIQGQSVPKIIIRSLCGCCANGRSQPAVTLHMGLQRFPKILTQYDPLLRLRE
jgi:hypothetical protein